MGFQLIDHSLRLLYISLYSTTHQIKSLISSIKRAFPYNTVTVYYFRFVMIEMFIAAGTMNHTIDTHLCELLNTSVYYP